MPKTIEVEKTYIVDERRRVITELRDKGYNDADIGRILFNVHRSTVVRAMEVTPSRKKSVH